MWSNRWIKICLVLDAIYNFCEWAVKITNWAIKRGGDFDFVWSQLNAPTWTKDVLRFFQDSPPLLSPFLIIVGIVLFFFLRKMEPKVAFGESAVSAAHPNYTDWDKSDYLTLWIAAHLWAGQEPVVDHPGGREPFSQIFNDLKTAVDLGHLPALKNPNQSANRFTRASRKDLRKYAWVQRQERPLFLYPEERVGIGREEILVLLGKCRTELVMLRNKPIAHDEYLGWEEHCYDLFAKAEGLIEKLSPSKAQLFKTLDLMPATNFVHAIDETHLLMLRVISARTQILNGFIEEQRPKQ